MTPSGTPLHEVLATDRPSSFLVRVAGRDQSVVDLEDPTRLEFDYVRRMGDVLDAVAEPGAPLRVLHVGGAGMTLPRYVSATRPRSWQVVLEPDERLTDLVRERVPLPRRSGIRVRPVAGRPGLGGVRPASVDVVVVDAFEDGAVPADLVSVEGLGALGQVLTERGRLLLNVADRAPFALARDVVAGLGVVFAAVVVSAEPATLRGRRAGNLVLVAGPDASPRSDLERRAASSAAPYRVLTADEVASRLGGGTPRHDPAATS